MKMTITVNRYENENLMGFAGIKFDEDFALENIRIKKAQSGALYVELPKYKRNTGNGEVEYREVFHPINSDMRAALNEAVLSSFERTSDDKKSFAYKYGDEPLNVTKVNIHLYEKDAMRGFANVLTTNGFVCENVKVKEGSNGLFVDLPKYRTVQKDEAGNIVMGADGNPAPAYKDIFHPITKEAYEKLKESVLKAYNDTSAKISQSKPQLVEEDDYAVSLGDVLDIKGLSGGIKR